MKGLVLLAIVLLIPSIGYFHKQHFQNILQPGLEIQVREILKAEGVVSPGVELNHLDATISGTVDSDEQRSRVRYSNDAGGQTVTSARLASD